MKPEDLAAIQRRQRLAQMMLAQGQKEEPTNQMAGGYVIPYSPVQGIAKIANQLAGTWLDKKSSEEYNKALSGINLDDPNAYQNLMSMGMPKEAMALRLSQINNQNKQQTRGIPTGFTRNEDGSIAPMPISNGTNYMDYQLELARQKAQIPGYGEPEKLDMQRQREAREQQRLLMQQEQQNFARQQALLNNQREQEKARQQTQAQLPVPALKMQIENMDSIKSVEGMNRQISDTIGLIENNEIEFGPIENVVNQAKNLIGASDEKSRNLAKFKTDLEQWRNGILLLHKGVQTEGDAKRAMNAIIQNINDKDIVAKQLKVLRDKNNQAIQAKKSNINAIRKNYGLPALDSQPTQQAPSADSLNYSSPTTEIQIENPELLSPEERAFLQGQINNDKKTTPQPPPQNDGLTPEEQEELRQLKARFGR